MAKKSSLKIKCHSLNSELPCWYCWLCWVRWDRSGLQRHDCHPLPVPDSRHFGPGPMSSRWRNTESKYNHFCFRLAGPEGEVGSKANHHFQWCGCKRDECWLDRSCLLSLHSYCPQRQPKWPEISLPDLQLSFSMALCPAHCGALCSISCIVITWC